MQLNEKETKWARETLDRVAHKLELVSERSKDKIPYTTVHGVHDDKSGEKEIGWWTNGFWGGLTTTTASNGCPPPWQITA